MQKSSSLVFKICYPIYYLFEIINSLTILLRLTVLQYILRFRLLRWLNKTFGAKKFFLNKINGVLYCNMDSIDGFNWKPCIRVSNIDTLLLFVCLRYRQDPQIPSKNKKITNFRKCFQKWLLRLHNLTIFHSQSLSLLSKRVKYRTCFKV